ncbi:hypothetical protein FIBSPDRAFT_1049289 [Athelia psychrophila]|uniref:Uncharacterized protein n=1 Tax=Athelia psychrophila TaxID=1759441 RepID=A0A166CES5_9AGAM|nr:hypothetical protein FIBSPDRAFT_1049289 [Fibularhizoctonia sp. CBS 109695]
MSRTPSYPPPSRSRSSHSLVSIMASPTRSATGTRQERAHARGQPQLHEAERQEGFHVATPGGLAALRTLGVAERAPVQRQLRVGRVELGPGEVGAVPAKGGEYRLSYRLSYSCELAHHQPQQLCIHLLPDADTQHDKPQQGGGHRPSNISHSSRRSYGGGRRLSRSTDSTDGAAKRSGGAEGKRGGGRRGKRKLRRPNGKLSARGGEGQGTGAGAGVVTGPREQALRELQAPRPVGAHEQRQLLAERAVEHHGRRGGRGGTGTGTGLTLRRRPLPPYHLPRQQRPLLARHMHTETRMRANTNANADPQLRHALAHARAPHQRVQLLGTQAAWSRAGSGFQLPPPGAPALAQRPALQDQALPLLPVATSKAHGNANTKTNNANSCTDTNANTDATPPPLALQPHAPAPRHRELAQTITRFT